MKKRKKQRETSYEIVMEHDFAGNKQGYMPGESVEDINALNNVASAGECTGLMPTPPASAAEAESYTDIYAVPQEKK